MVTTEFVCRSHNKLLRLSLEKLSKKDDYHFVRSRIRAVRSLRYLLKDRHDHFAGLRTFAPLVQSIESLDRFMEECELALRRYAVGEVSVDELDTLINDDIVGALNDSISELGPIGSGDDQASYDAQELMERAWSWLMPHMYALQDALQSASDVPWFAVAEWHLRFDREEERWLTVPANV